MSSAGGSGVGKACLNGVSLNFRQIGAGPDVVLIHGLATSLAFWPLHFLLALRSRYRVTAYDLRGHGYSGTPPSGYTSADMAADLHALLDHLGIQRAHLVGHSFGGVVALHYATVHPERVASLVVADSRVRALQPVQRVRDWPDWKSARRTLERLGFNVPEDETEVGFWFLDRLTSQSWQEVRRADVRRALFLPFVGRRSVRRTAERWLKLVASTTVRADVTSVAGLTPDRVCSIDHPTLAIYGERSRGLESCRGLQARLPNCRTVIVPRTGHFHPLIRPSFLLKTINEFLSGVESGARRGRERARSALQRPSRNDQQGRLSSIEPK